VRYSLWYNALNMWPVGCLEAAELRYQTTDRPHIECIPSCIAKSNAPEDGQNSCPKHVELIGIINRQLLLHLVGCLPYYLYQRCTVKQISHSDDKYLSLKPVAHQHSYGHRNFIFHILEVCSSHEERHDGRARWSERSRSNNNNILLTANGLIPGGSGYFTCIQNSDFS
jgi:hypothetical protein